MKNVMVEHVYTGFLIFFLFPLSFTLSHKPTGGKWHSLKISCASSSSPIVITIFQHLANKSLYIWNPLRNSSETAEANDIDYYWYSAVRFTTCSSPIVSSSLNFSLKLCFFALLLFLLVKAKLIYTDT